MDTAKREGGSILQRIQTLEKELRDAHEQTRQVRKRVEYLEEILGDRRPEEPMVEPSG